MRDPTGPRWRCGEPACPHGMRWQPVSAMGEYDDVDVALADLEAHYARAHPESGEEVTSDARLCAAA